MQNYLITALAAIVIALVSIVVVLARRSPEQKYLDRLHELELNHGKLVQAIRSLELQWEEFYDKTRRLSSRLDKERGLAAKKNLPFDPEPGMPEPDDSQMQLPENLQMRPQETPPQGERGDRTTLLSNFLKGR